MLARAQMCVRILDWVDGPQLVRVKRCNGTVYIAVAEPGDWYLGAKVSEVQEQDFMRGKIDLRALFLSCPLVGIIPDQKTSDLVCALGEWRYVPMTKDKLLEEFLPLEGYFYRQDEQDSDTLGAVSDVKE